MVDDLRSDRQIAYTTVMTVMDNLYRKGWLRRHLDGRARRAAAFALVPLPLALTPAVVALALGRIQPV